MKSLPCVFAVACLWGAIAVGNTLYWDGTDISDDADGGNGIWNTSLMNWDSAATSGTSVTWMHAFNAVFGGTAGIVTLGESISAGTVMFNMPGYEIATAGFDATWIALAGTGSFSKSGSGTLTLTGENSTYTGRIVVDSGILRLGTGWNVLGAHTSATDKITVAAGATLDVAGWYDTDYGLTLAGSGTTGQGAYINSGSDTGEGHIQFPNIALSANATIGGSGTFYIIAPGYGASALNLNGHTLTKVGANAFLLVNTTVGAGTIRVAEGGFGVLDNGVRAHAVALTLDNKAGAELRLNNSWLAIGSLSGGGSAGGNVSLGAGTLYVGALNTDTVYAGVVSGTGILIKEGSGSLTLAGASTHTGTTELNAGRLNLTGSLPSLLNVNNGTFAWAGGTVGTLSMNGGRLALAGGTTTQGLTAQTAAFNNPVTAVFDSGPIQGTVYDIIFYGGGTVTGLGNLSVPYRGTLTDDTVNQKITFTATADGHDTRTWSNATNIWDHGATESWLEGDRLFYTGDHVIFGDITADTTITLSGALSPSSVTVSNAANRYVFEGGKIAGGVKLTKTGTGTLVLSNANSYVGTTVVSGGVAKIGNVSAFGNHWVNNLQQTYVTVTPGGTVDFNGVHDAVYGYAIAGAGADGNGALINTGDVIDNGKAQASSIRLDADAAIGGLSDWALLTYSYAPTRLDLNGQTLTKTGTNTIYLCNTMLSTGMIRIVSGTLSQTGPGISDATQTAFWLDDTPGATLALNWIDLAVGSLEGGGVNGARVVIDGTLTVGTLSTSNSFAGTITGYGTLVKTGTNVWVLSGKNMEFHGPVVVNDGILNLGCEGAAGVNDYAALGATYYEVNKVTIAAGATLDIAGFGNTSYGFTIAGTGATGEGALINTGDNTSLNHIQTPFIALSNDATIGGAGDFSMIGSSYSETALTLNGHTLTKSGANTFHLINTTVHTGTIHIAAGSLALFSKASDASTAAISLADRAGATLSLNDQNFFVGSLSGGGVAGGQVSLGWGTLTIGGLDADADYAGSITGPGALVKIGTGTQSLSGANTYSGTTTVSNGILRINGTHTGGGYLLASGAILGGTGTVSMASGTVEVQAGATLDPGTGAGTGGTLTLNALAMDAGAKLHIDHPADRLIIQNSLTLNNAIVTLANTHLFDTAAGVAYPILTCNGVISGAFQIQIDDSRWIVKRSGNTFYLRFNYPGTVTIIK